MAKMSLTGDILSSRWAPSTSGLTHGGFIQQECPLVGALDPWTSKEVSAGLGRSEFHTLCENLAPSSVWQRGHETGSELDGLNVRSHVDLRPLLGRRAGQ